MISFLQPAKRSTVRFNRAAVVNQITNPEHAARLLGDHLACSDIGIHLPKNLSPESLDGRARNFWQRAYETANAIYRDDDVAEHSAWKALRLFFRVETHGRRTSATLDSALRPKELGPVAPLGNPKTLVDLGVLIEITYFSVVGGFPTLEVHRFRDDQPPSLLWDDTSRTAYAFPRAERTACTQPNPASATKENEYQIYKTWHQRPPKCIRWIEIPDVRVRLIGQVDTIVYRSDKWHSPQGEDNFALHGAQEYIHQTNQGVSLWESFDEPPQRRAGSLPNPDHSQEPQAFVINGGCFALHRQGLVQ